MPSLPHPLTARKPAKFALLALSLALAILIPASGALGSYGLYVLSLIAIYGLVTTGLTLFMGYAGQLSICQAAFYGIGAYTAANLTKAGSPFLAALPLAAAAAGVVGLAIGLVTLRLRGFYLAIITLAFGLIAFQVFKNFDAFTGGVSGIGRIPNANIFGTRLGPLGYYFVTLACLLLGLLIAWRIVVSPAGRAMRAIAANDLASQALGIDSYLIKVVVFTCAAAFAGLGGALYAHLARYITPDDFGLMFSILFITMAIVGGLQNVTGGLVGAVVVTIASEELRAFPAAQPILYGTVLVLLVRFMPYGVVGSLSRLGVRLAEFAGEKVRAHRTLPATAPANSPGDAA